MRHIRLLVEYDGTDLCGWQRQLTGPTVQAHLEDALATFLQHETAVTGASRTDSGVHARGQVASFWTARTIPLLGIRRGVNALLPHDIAILDATEVVGDWHPRHSATGKHYRYTVLARADRSPAARRTAWHVPESLDLAAMRAAADLLAGEHDFAAFRAAGCAAKTTIRRIHSIDLTPADPLLYVDVRGNAFLRNMVRIVAGTLVEVGKGRFTPAQVAGILAGGDRTRGGVTAPAHGLELLEVRYDGRKLAAPHSVI